MSVKQITVRHPPPELVESLKALAAARGESLNATVIRVLSEARGVEDREWLRVGLQLETSRGPARPVRL